MVQKSKIEWTEATWNPIKGCSIVSPGCTNCYAMKMAARIEAMGNQPAYAGTTKKVNGNSVWTGKVAQAPKATLLEPLRRKKPTTYFVNSMGDLFHEDVPDEWIDKVFAVMALSPQHTFQVLTKRSKRMREYLTRMSHNAERDARNELPAIWQQRLSEANPPATLPLTMDCVRRALGISLKFSYDPPTPKWPLPNVWLGVSTEDQQRADERIPDLLATPAAVRWISAEPLLGPIDLTEIDDVLKDDLRLTINSLTGDVSDGHDLVTGVFGRPDPRIDWIIVGGESGNGARPMHPDWARGLRDQCAAAGVAFFFKQWGAWSAVDEPASETQEDEELRGVGEMFDGEYMRRVGKKAAGRLLDGVEHNGMPEAR